MGANNTNQLNFGTGTKTNECIDDFTSQGFLPYILGTSWSTILYAHISTCCNHSTDPDLIVSSYYVCEMKARLTIPPRLHMGNYDNQVHHTTNTRECREVKKLLDLPLYMLETCYFVVS